jgi:hypothetical protein
MISKSGLEVSISVNSSKLSTEPLALGAFTEPTAKLFVDNIFDAPCQSAPTRSPT